MPRFFVDAVQISGDTVTLTGDDAHHISRSLRMASGEHITVCDGKGMEYRCVLTDFFSDRVCAGILCAEPSGTEPPYRAVIYQALPKGDKMDSIIQKAVECGTAEIVPFESERCIVRMRENERERKGERRNRIALEAAKQCGRGIIPSVRDPIGFAQAVSDAASAALPLFCYEGEGTEPLPSVLRKFSADCVKKAPVSISVMIGSEGGFSPDEVACARNAGMIPVGLGRRILRTETVASFVLACLAYELELT